MKQRLPNLLSRLKMITFGYVAAAFATGAAILGGASLLALAQKLFFGTGGVAPVTNSLLALVFLTAIIAVIAALPALGLALCAEIFKLRHWSVYVLGGMALTFAASRGLSTFQGTADFLFFLAAGMLGGAVYWRIAGRHAGGWEILDETHFDDTNEVEEPLSSHANPPPTTDEEAEKIQNIPPPGL
jgi:hypothetical protein